MGILWVCYAPMCQTVAISSIFMAWVIGTAWKLCCTQLPQAQDTSSTISSGFSVSAKGTRADSWRNWSHRGKVVSTLNDFPAKNRRSSVSLRFVSKKWVFIHLPLGTVYNAVCWLEDSRKAAQQPTLNSWLWTQKNLFKLGCWTRSELFLFRKLQVKSGPLISNRSGKNGPMISIISSLFP